MIRLSRRDLLRYGASLWAASCVRSEAAPINKSGLNISLAQEFAQSTVKAISPDGTKICLEDWAERGNRLRVVETGSWRTIYSSAFHSSVTSLSFFPDNKAFYLHRLGGAGENIYWHGIVDVDTGKCLEQKHPLDSSQGDYVWAAVNDRNLLLTHHSSLPHLTETVEIVKYPDFMEILKVPYATQPREPRRRSGNIELSNDMGFGVSDDRKFLAYSFDHTLLCRRMSDLQILWTRKLKLFALKVVVSSRGSYVAAAFTDFKSEYGFAVYDGNTGTELMQLPVKGTNGIALSPDGKLVAVVERSIGKDQVAVPIINIYEVASGQQLASVAHDKINSGRRQFLESGCTVSFTSDGKYLISSGMRTKVWSLKYF